MTNNKPLKDEESSSQQMLQKLMEEESFWDVELQGSDGVKVGANRAVVGSKSTALQNLLFGPFAEAKQSVVPIGFPGIVLKAVVEYIHTETASILETSLSPSEIDWDSPGQFDATKLLFGKILALFEAANYFGLSGLSQKIPGCLSKVVKEVPPLALILLESIHQAGPTVTQEIQAIAWKPIRSSAELISCGAVKSLSHEVMELILQNDDLDADEYQLFQMIQLWCYQKGKEHKVIARNMTEYIKLENIKPSLLSTTVASSGLVTSNQLKAAHQAQTLNPALEHGGDVQTRRRALPVWKNSKSEVTADCETFERGGTDWIEINPEIGGILRWTLLLEHCDGPSQPPWFGIAYVKALEATTDPVPRSFYALTADDTGNNMLSWNGAKMEVRTDLDALKFSAGAKIAFELDLTANAHANGNLYASMNDGPLTPIFCNMKSWEQHQLLGLVPFVAFASYSERTRVRLLDVSRSFGNIPNAVDAVVTEEQISGTEEQ